MASGTNIQQCPSCGRVVYFSHGGTNVFTCTCGQALLRDQGQVNKQPFLIIREPASIIQPGVQGQWNGRTFKVLGRFRAWIEEFVFNYWTIVFNDEQLGYLGEGYGLYSIYEPLNAEHSLNTRSLDGTKVGSKKNVFTDDAFILERKYTCYFWEVEAELFMPYHSVTFKTYEFAHTDGRRIEIMDFGGDKMAAYHVHYTDFSSLSLSGTRSYAPFAKALTCKQCGHTNKLKAFPYTQSYGCTQCGARYTLEDGVNFQQANPKAYPPDGADIPLGSKGAVKGIEYEVIGFVQKEESNIYKSKWKEYTLFNPQEGFAFLSEYNGHWIYAREQGEAPVLESQTSDSLVYGGEPFRLFNKYSFKVLNATGEFPYNSFNDQDKDVKEFISPPEIWIQEKNTREGILWFKGEHTSSKELKQAFGKDIALPYKIGVGAVQPGYVSPGKVAFVTIVAVLVMVFAHALSIMDLQNRVIIDGNYNMDTSDTVNIVTEKFVLNKRSSNLEFNITAPVKNSWFELTATLVNTQTGPEYTIEKGVEYYQGYEDGYEWSEGSKYATAYLNQIPAGTYLLQLQGVSEHRFPAFPMGESFVFNVHVRYDVPMDRNLIIGLVGIILWGLIHYLIVMYKEQSRWQNSPI